MPELLLILLIVGVFFVAFITNMVVVSESGYKPKDGILPICLTVLFCVLLSWEVLAQANQEISETVEVPVQTITVANGATYQIFCYKGEEHNLTALTHHIFGEKIKLTTYNPFSLGVLLMDSDKEFSFLPVESENENEIGVEHDHD